MSLLNCWPHTTIGGTMPKDHPRCQACTQGSLREEGNTLANSFTPSLARVPNPMNRSEELFNRAQKVIPGGVNSPVRAFRAVGGKPLFIQRGQGAHIWDADGNEYIDYVGSWGPLIFGHRPAEVIEALNEVLEIGTSFGAPTEREVELAELITKLLPSIELVRLVSSGTEATTGAILVGRWVQG